MENHDIDLMMMRRAIQLASKADRQVKENPKVGCVIAFHDKIIGEGYHHKSGGNHAEIEALRSIKSADRRLLPDSHLYVTLEPCNHHGKTPPCTDSIIKAGIKQCSIGSLDPNPLMQGKSVKLLRSLGLAVDIGLCEKEAISVNKVFMVNQHKKRPLIHLKWAQSKDGYMGKKDEQISISNKISKVYVHKLRSQYDAILIGTGTALTDDPSLTTREYPGTSPIRVVLDIEGKIPGDYQLLSDDHQTIIYSEKKRPDPLPENKQWKTLTTEEFTLTNILNDLNSNNIYSIMVEGGAKLHGSFIKENIWDIASVIHSPKKIDGNIRAPYIRGVISEQFSLNGDIVFEVTNPT